MNAHDHGLPQGTATNKHRRKLILVVAITLTIVVVQVLGAVLSGSLALLADAGHMLSDAAGVSIALFAAWIATRPATRRSTYGYQRAEVLAALANAIILVVIAVVILIEALRRISTTPDIRTDVMIVTAVIGAAANLACLLILRDGQAESLNLRGAYLEVLGDLLGSVAVIVAAIVIATTGFLQADALASIAIALMILPRAWSLLREVINVLLEAAPKGVDSEMIRSHILGVDGVVGVHDIHAWTITSGVPVFSAHVVVDGETLNAEGVDQVLDRLTHCLRNHFDTRHCTFQIEPAEHAVHETRQHA
ncbi:MULTISPECIES: cation diffusion facilitator family transporter [unclassified Arthrobacter]|uniref:cation diffusion facilitator family transporter n=1 Tax=unclassified Arthrobacter TaxID=235627 RepID=UPI001490BB0E|nr:MULTISPECIES: cation diffusion facilitator family transporter [unclassified Arthrobacter]MBE0008319.1 cation transporter [Arthrobacter sp. AET 35A]NOJ62058.1 cation transporter [Arthrobacter sp. 147(2020)]